LVSMCMRWLYSSRLLVSTLFISVIRSVSQLLSCAAWTILNARTNR
jgi:hypothetical protein